MKKALKTYLIVMGVAFILSVFVVVPISHAYKHRLRSEVGKQYVIDGNTYTIVDYSETTVTLSNGVKIRYELLKQSINSQKDENKMIKVIKLGNLPIEVPVAKSRSKCGVVFSYQKEDIQVDKDGSYVICPHCGSFISAR